MISKKECTAENIRNRLKELNDYFFCFIMVDVKTLFNLFSKRDLTKIVFFAILGMYLRILLSMIKSASKNGSKIEEKYVYVVKCNYFPLISKIWLG